MQNSWIVFIRSQKLSISKLFLMTPNFPPHTSVSTGARDWLSMHDDHSPYQSPSDTSLTFPQPQWTKIILDFLLRGNHIGEKAWFNQRGHMFTGLFINRYLFNYNLIVIYRFWIHDQPYHVPYFCGDCRQTVSANHSSPLFHVLKGIHAHVTCWTTILHHLQVIHTPKANFFIYECFITCK